MELVSQVLMSILLLITAIQIINNDDSLIGGVILIMMGFLAGVVFVPEETFIGLLSLAIVCKVVAFSK